MVESLGSLVFFALLIEGHILQSALKFCMANVSSMAAKLRRLPLYFQYAINREFDHEFKFTVIVICLFIFSYFSEQLI